MFYLYSRLQFLYRTQIFVQINRSDELRVPFNSESMEYVLIRQSLFVQNNRSDELSVWWIKHSQLYQ